MTNPLHVVVIIPRFFPAWGGSEIRIRRIAEALSPRGFRFTVLTRRFSHSVPREEMVGPIKVVRLPHMRPLFRRAVRAWLSAHKDDISLVHSVRLDVMGPLGAWAHDTLQLPHMAEIITYEVAKLQRRGQHHRLRSIFSGSDCIHCLSEETAEGVRREGVPEPKIWLRGNAVDCALYAPSCLERARPDPVTVLCCGRLEKQKGTDVLIRAWGLLPEEVRAHAQLLLAGTGKWEAKIRRAAAPLGNVRFLGAVARDAMPELYRQAQIYVQPSRFEGMSNAILEAMASGLPLISTEIGANQGVIENGVNGYKVAVEDAAALSEKLAQLIGDKAQRLALGAAGRQMAESQFSLSALYDDFAARYQALAGKALV